MLSLVMSLCLCDLHVMSLNTLTICSSRLMMVKYQHGFNSILFSTNFHKLALD